MSGRYRESVVEVEILQDQVVAALRGRVADIIIGAVFVFVGLAACGIATIRRRSGVRVLVWVGIWSAMYGVRPLLDSLAILELLPPWLKAAVPYLNTVIEYLIVVVAGLAWLDLSLGKLRSFLVAAILLGLAIGGAGIIAFVLTGSNDKLMPVNNLLITLLLGVQVTVVAVPRLSRKFLALPQRGVVLVGTMVFFIEALYTQLARPLGLPSSFVLDSLAFAALLFSFGHVALQIVMGNERRLLSIEKELAIAREIQTAILPSKSPEITRLRIATAYRPMREVAGDFYDFIPVDRRRVGILVADASGHGVPAALIAAMIKVAVQSVVPCARDPRGVLRGLNRILSGELRDQLVTASYLWLDTEQQEALYSAAGHPPLLWWREGKLERIESNGLVFGVGVEADYPVCHMPINPGDRFLLYTDGVVEPENARGDPFGDRQLEQVVRENASRPASELADSLLREIRGWQPASTSQQDDMTLVVIDVV